MSDLSKATQDLFKKFSAHYLNTWVKTNREDMLSQARHWKQELELAEMTDDDVYQTINDVLGSQEFSTFPPNTMQFIGTWKRKNAHASNPVVEQTEKAMSLLRSAYLKAKSNESEVTLSHWSESFNEEGVPAAMIVPAVKALMKRHRYATFPPTLIDVCYEAYRQMVDINLPAPESVVEMGMTGLLSKEPIMIEAKRRVGEHRLRTSETKKADPLFMESYFSVLKDVALGNIELSKPPAAVPEAPTSSASGVIKDILKDW